MSGRICDSTMPREKMVLLAPIDVAPKGTLIMQSFRFLGSRLHALGGRKL